MKGCTACKMRAGCSRVVTAEGQTDSPILLVIGEAPGYEEDASGRPFIGSAGLLLRDAIRETGVLNRSNTLITNVLKCRPPNDEFPKGDPSTICTTLWLNREIDLAKPKRLLLLGNVPLKHVANLKGVTNCRGNWYDVRGIRTMVTYHPKYVARQDAAGDIRTRHAFEDDINQVAKEVRRILEQPPNENTLLL